MAASNIAKKAFPDLKEDAINAVYDLCEDQDRNIRIEGYKAIVRIAVRSRLVLVEELRLNVVVRRFFPKTNQRSGIKMALIQHLELDSMVTLGVLCDQIVPQTTPWKMKTRPSASTSARSSSRSSPRMHGSPSSRIYRTKDILIKVLFKYPTVDAAKIIEDIFVFLPPFNDGRATRHGNELVQLLLARAASALGEDLAPGRNSASLEQSRGAALAFLLHILSHGQNDARKAVPGIARVLRRASGWRPFGVQSSEEPGV
ncbi:hypothetical protein H4582DRAFT_2077125 [Lactarius indigo]|nr:hypothetical protein H4582DRAFT_2077125 [Lactarius indigo]